MFSFFPFPNLPEHLFHTFHLIHPVFFSPSIFLYSQDTLFVCTPRICSVIGLKLLAHGALFLIGIYALFFFLVHCGTYLLLLCIFIVLFHVIELAMCPYYWRGYALLVVSQGMYVSLICVNSVGWPWSIYIPLSRL